MTLTVYDQLEAVSAQETSLIFPSFTADTAYTLVRPDRQGLHAQDL